VIRASDLGLPAADGGGREAVSASGGSPGEREQIQAALARARGVVSKAAAELGLSRQALYRRMERLGLSITRKVGA
jgi:transcriptional regulator of acetoin/glycerol metabolism